MSTQTPAAGESPRSLAAVSTDFILARVEVDAATGCWMWRRKRDRNGYGEFHMRPRMYRAHRASYEAFVGPIPDGLAIDHLCHTRSDDCRGGDSCPHRACVNPEHLEPVPTAVNNQRAPFGNARKSHCKRGHEFTPENTYLRYRAGAVSRECRICKTAGRLPRAQLTVPAA